MVLNKKITQKYNFESGLGKITLIVLGFVICVSLFVGSKVLPFYYYYYELQSHMEALVKLAGSNSDKEIRKKMNYHIKKMGIPVDEEDLEVVRNARTMKISLEYEEVFYFDWKDETYELYVFPFLAQAEGPY